MYGVQGGMEYKAPGARDSHAIYLQVGFTQDDAGFASYPGPGVIGGGRTDLASVDLDIIPITLNYKYERNLVGHLNGYVGLGLGIVILDSSYDSSWMHVTSPPAPFSGTLSDDQTNVRFYGEVSAGLSYDVCSAFEVFAGVRYIFMDNRNLNIAGAFNYDAGINDDFLFEGGLRFHF